MEIRLKIRLKAVVSISEQQGGFRGVQGGGVLQGSGLRSPQPPRSTDGVRQGSRWKVMLAEGQCDARAGSSWRDS